MLSDSSGISTVVTQMQRPCVTKSRHSGKAVQWVVGSTVAVAGQAQIDVAPEKPAHHCNLGQIARNGNDKRAFLDGPFAAVMPRESQACSKSIFLSIVLLHSTKSSPSTA